MRLSINAANRQTSQPANRWVRVGLVMCLLHVAVWAFAAACGDDDNASSDNGKISVVTTLPLFADFVREIGGEGVAVTSLVPTSADPHTWEPAPSDVQRVTEADIAFANGLDLEPAAINVIEANLRRGTTFIELGEEVKASHAISDFDPASADLDPHLWMDPRLAGEYARSIMTALNLFDTDNAPRYKDNLSRYYEELDALRMLLREAVGAIPPEHRKLVTTHNAFSHLARSLRGPNPSGDLLVDFEVVAVLAESPGQEPSPEDVANLARAIEREGVPAVFVEPQIEGESEILRQAAEDAGVEVCTLYSDSLDDRVASYIELMRFNADELARCLGTQN